MEETRKTEATSTEIVSGIALGVQVSVLILLRVLAKSKHSAIRAVVSDYKTEVDDFLKLTKENRPSSTSSNIMEHLEDILQTSLTTLESE